MLGGEGEGECLLLPVLCVSVCVKVDLGGFIMPVCIVWIELEI